MDMNHAVLIINKSLVKYNSDNFWEYCDYMNKLW